MTTTATRAISRASLLAFAAAVLGACGTVSGGVFDLPLLSPAEQAQWEFTDSNAFRWTDDGGLGCLELHGASTYRPPHRSPLAMALLREPEFGDFVLQVQARQTTKEYAHRDLVIVFAYRDAAHFAYAHLASVGDANAHHVMLVDGADRRPGSTSRTTGVTWGDGWHELELRRQGTRVEVFFDGGGPVLVGDVPAGPGRIGIGSFDDTGRFRRLRVAPL